MPQLRDIWEELRSGAFLRESFGFRMQLFGTGPDLRIYAAVEEPTGRATILVELPENIKLREFAKMSSKAFDAQTGDFVGLPDGHTGAALVLRQESYEDLFALLSGDIVRAVQGASTPALAVRAFVAVVERWRRFIERGRSQLSEERVRGLIGELVVLARLARHLGVRITLPSWTGPLDALRDFQLPDFSVEVKTYQSDTGASLRMSDAQQLDDVEGRPVFLTAVKLSQSEIHGLNLPQFVGILREVISPDEDMLELFSIRLAEYGYMDIHAENYTDRFLIEKLTVFHVREGFPYIRSSDVPLGVHDVHFSVDLSAMTQFSVDSVDVLGRPQGLFGKED